MTSQGVARDSGDVGDLRLGLVQPWRHDGRDPRFIWPEVAALLVAEDGVGGNQDVR